MLQKVHIQGHSTTDSSTSIDLFHFTYFLGLEKLKRNFENFSRTYKKFVLMSCTPPDRRMENEVLPKQ